MLFAFTPPWKNADVFLNVAAWGEDIDDGTTGIATGK